MTAAELHSLPDPGQDERYEAGRAHWRVDSRFGDVHLTLTGTTGWTAATLVACLDDEDVDDLLLALERAGRARDTYRANELERNR